MLQQDKIPLFIVHHKPNTDRRAYFEIEFAKQNLYYEVIDGYHPDDITKPDSDTITVQEYSLCLKHEQALKTALERNCEYCIVFEDDVVLNDSFKDYFNLFFPEFVSLNGDLLMIGTAFEDFPCILTDAHVYHEPRFKTRCTHAILYTAKCAQIILSELHNGIYKGYDHKLNNIIEDKNLKSCWLEPGLHQSSIGNTPYFKFPTSIR